MTDLRKKQIVLLFTLLDHSTTRNINLNGFYTLLCILLAHQVWC